MHPDRTAILAALMCTAGSCAGAQARHAAPAQTAIRYGIFHLSGFNHGTAGPSGATVSGPNTRVTLDDTAHSAAGVLQAPTISVTVDSRSHAWIARLSGGVRFHISQVEQSGTRSADGTSASARYDSGAATIRLSGGVSAAVTDPALLAGAANIRVGQLTMRISGDHRIELGGTPSQDRISANPLPAKGTHANGGAEHVEVSGFSQGTVTQSRSAQFDGPAVTATVTQSAGGTASIRGTSLSVTGTSKGVTSADAAGPVAVAVTRPATKSQEAFAANGTAETGHLDIAGHSALLQHSVQLQATFGGGRAVVECDSLKAAWSPTLRFFASGMPGHAVLRFIPASKAAAQAGAPSGSLDGTLRLEQFDNAEVSGGTSATAAGTAMVIRAASADGSSSAVIHAHHLTAAIAKGTLSSAQAWGALTFRFRRTAPSPQQLTGTGDRATLTTVNGAQKVAVTGPMRAGITDPSQFDGPALLEGLEGDTLTVLLNHGSYSMNIDSPNETASLQMTPIKHPAPAPAVGKPHGR